MIENCDAVIFDFDGTLYDYKNISLNTVMNAPLRFSRIKAERDARRNLMGIDLARRNALTKPTPPKSQSFPA